MNNLNDKYREAYVELSNAPDPATCLCYILSGDILSGAAYNTPGVMEDFPDFALFEPPDGRCRWFTDLENRENERNERLTVLAFCIAMTD